MNSRLATIAILAFGTLPSYAATLQATYAFGGVLTAQEAGVPALSPTDPLGLNGFLTDSVSGQSATVYHFDGSPASQGGLTFDNSGGLLTSNSYSVELLFKFIDTASAWHRILDVQDRASDSGFYIDPSDNEDLFPVQSGPDTYISGQYHRVVLTNSNGTVKAYLDGVLEFTTSSTEMDINNPDNPNARINLFLDNTTGGGQGEWSPGNIALARFYDGALTDQEVAALASPEPATLGLLLGGFGLLAVRSRRPTSRPGRV